MSDDYTPAREYSGELAHCDMCDYADADTEYVPPLAAGFKTDPYRRDHDGTPWPTGRFLKRICMRCGYAWAEACLGDEVACGRCGGDGIDPVGSVTATYGDGTVREQGEPCRDCQFPAPSLVGVKGSDGIKGPVGVKGSDGVTSQTPTCGRCGGDGIDPLGSVIVTYGDGTVREQGEPCRDCQFPPQHTGGNAEDCSACAGTNPPYPFICPGNDTGPCSKCSGKGRFLNSWRLWQECGECTG